MRMEEIYLIKYKECRMKIRNLIEFVEKNGHLNTTDYLISIYIRDLKIHLSLYEDVIN